MRFKLIFPILSILKLISCNESESTEVKHIEITPYYDTIIFSDVVDIINELSNNNSPFGAFLNSESESDENFEDLLTEYQHYLEKAHEQRRTYMGQLNQTKNKVPLLRHENFMKTRLPPFDKYNNYYNLNSYYNPSMMKIPPTTFNSPLDLFIPINPPLRFMKSPEHDPLFQKKGEEYPRFDKGLSNLMPTLPPLFSKPFEELMEPPSACICPANQIPCKCNCKQCHIQFTPTTPNDIQQKSQYADNNRKLFSPNHVILDPRIQEHLMEDMPNSANAINVKIKVDIQLPKNLNALSNYNNQQHSRDSAVEYDDNSKELNNIRIPTTSFNFPIPLNMFGRSSKLNKHENSPFRKITIHKKKKSKLNGGNNNKRHRKKLIAFHDVKVSSPQTSKPITYENHNVTVDRTTTSPNYTYQSNLAENVTINVVPSNYTTTSTEIPKPTNTTQVVDSIYLMVNISNTNENDTEDIHKTGNSIELEATMKPNTSIKPRLKRDVTSEKKNNFAITKTAATSIFKTHKTNLNESKVANNVKKCDKVMSDSELLYWPNSFQNSSESTVKTITEIILERETKKEKINMSTESIRHNRTLALERAIFGQVDWYDIDAVVPTFISFVGKYINGILTFCSQKICHSIKCAEKACIHRTCPPEQRFNHIGHCLGSNKTDSVASMESIMDLPSNVGFEIVDILQDKLFGQLYGKVTLCISSKCISFATCKKTFMKSKCAAKTLSKTGHCTNLKKN